MKRQNTFTLILLCSTLCWNTAYASKPRDFNLQELNITQVHSAIKQGEITCQTLTNRYLNRIKRFDSKINAITQLNPNALHKAKQLDKEFSDKKKLRYLHCIPVILKDNFDTADMPTEAGSIALKGSLPPDDATMVKKLRQAGAIIIAKSNMAEWAFSPYETISSTHGETKNAYDLSRVPAGSSGGTASAIAANFGIIGMGTDTGNSIRGPASHLSLVGIRSTIGMTSRDGVVPLLLNRDIAGPLMRTVRDTAMVFNVLAGYDPNDPVTLAAKHNRKSDYTKYLKTNGLKGARLAVLREMFDKDEANKEILQLMENAISDLKALGSVIVDPFIIKDFKKLSKATGFCSRFRFDLNHYLNSLGDTRPVKSLEEIIDKKLFDKRNNGAMKWAMSVDVKPQEQNPPCIDVKGDPRRQQFLHAVLAKMDTESIDAIIYPSWSNPPRKLGDLKSPHGNNSPVIAPHTGQPAITVPMGFTSNGLPAGLQLLAKPFDEHKLFQYAYAYEQKTKHRKSPKLFE